MSRNVRARALRSSNNRVQRDLDAYDLMDEYEELPPVDVGSLVNPNLANGDDDIPVVDVDESSDDDDDMPHDPKENLCVCADCVKKIKKAKREGEQPCRRSPNEAQLKCFVCFSLTVDGGTHRPCLLACGHVFGLHCILSWLAPGHRKCPQCNLKARKRDLRPIFATSVRDEILGDALEAAQTVKQSQAKMAKKITDLVELNQLLYDSLKKYGETVALFGGLSLQ